MKQDLIFTIFKIRTGISVSNIKIYLVTLSHAQLSSKGRNQSISKLCIFYDCPFKLSFKVIQGWHNNVLKMYFVSYRCTIYQVQECIDQKFHRSYTKYDNIIGIFYDGNALKTLGGQPLSRKIFYLSYTMCLNLQRDR